MTDVLIKRELLERIAKPVVLRSQEDAHADACAELRAILAAPRQPEGEALDVVAWNITVKMDGRTRSEYTEKLPFLPDAKVTWHSEPEPVCRLSDAQRAIAELRDRLDVMTQCADNYSRMFEESAEECERLRVKLMTIASAEPGRHNIEWAKAMAATGNNEAYATWREALRQRDKLAGLLREVRVIVAREVERWTRAAEILPVNARVESGLLTRIDAALAKLEGTQCKPGAT